MKFLIKNGHVIDPANNIDGIFNVYIENGTIEKVEKNLEIGYATKENTIDATGKIVAAGLIDMHVHLREPGLEYKEDIRSGTLAAAMGGFTSIACMPNTKPVVDSAVVVEYINSVSKRDGVVNVLPIGAITKGQVGEELAEIGDMKQAGAVAISEDGKTVKNSSVMRKAMQYASMFQMTVISHCEDADLANGGSVNEGYMSTFLGLRGIPNVAEDVIVARDIMLAKSVDTGVHIAHVSTKGAVDIIRRAKKDGIKVTAETAPHYFVLNENAVDGFNTYAKMNPPLRTEEDRLAIIEGLKDGTLDVIATDHAPHHFDEKNCEFAAALNGIVGLETSLGLSYKYLVEAGHLTMNQLIEKMSANPAKILGINKGSLKKGSIADITIIDISQDYTVDVNTFKSKGKNTPFNGYSLKGKAVYTIVDGEIIMRNGKIGK